MRVATAAMRAIRAMGLRTDTESGMQFLAKALDPSHETSLGIPDLTNQLTCKLDRAATQVIPKPNISGTWDACILCLPSDVDAFIVAAGAAGTDFSDPNFWDLPAQGASSVTVDSVKFPGRQATKVLESWGFDEASGIRCSAKELHIELIAPNLANQGSVVSGQIAAEPRIVNLIAQLAGATPNDPTAVLMQIDVPLSEEELRTLDPHCHVGRAHDGVNQVLKFRDQRHEFVGTHTGSGGRRVLEVVNSSSVGPVTRFPTDLSGPNARVIDWMSVIDSTNLGVTFIRGLAPEAALQVSVNRAEELIPTASSVLAPTKTPSPVFDPTALLALAQAQQATPSATAAGEGIGKVVGGIATGVEKAAGVVGTVAGGIAGIFN